MRSLLAALALAAAPAALAAQDVQQQQPPADAELVRKMMAAAQPGPEHERLASLAGTWDVEITFFMGPQPTKAKAVAENRMILGDRFLESRTAGGAAPMTIESLGIYGFDRRHGKYTITGYDTWGTYSVSAAGGWDDATRTATMHGTDDDPIAKHTQVYDMHLRFVDADTYVTDVVFTDSAHTGGKGPFKAFEAIHRRRK